MESESAQNPAHRAIRFQGRGDNGIVARADGELMHRSVRTNDAPSGIAQQRANLRE